MGSSPTIATYNAAGDGLSVYDRQGGGPGEFSRPPRLLPGPEESFYGVDAHLINWFDSEFTLLDTWRSEIRADRVNVIVLASGHFVVSQDFAMDD